MKLDAHGINEHVIVLSLNDLVKKQMPLRWLITKSINMLDPSVIVINQIMYTFHRQNMIVAEKVSGETWSWRSSDYKTYSPQLRYDYDNNLYKMIAWLSLYKIGSLLEYTFAFGVISGINALFIRVVLKCSGLMIFPMISIQNYFSRRPITHNQQRLIYMSMGDIGALAAYLDREGISRSIIYGTYFSSLALYYVMYIACSHIWTIMCFSNMIYSENVNQAYFFYVNMLELGAFIFIRTRSSIKYFPKIVTLANISFLFYVNSTMYSSQYEALSLL